MEYKNEFERRTQYVADEVSLVEFLQYTPKYTHEMYLRVFTDETNRQLRLYMSQDPDDIEKGEYWYTVIDDVHIKYSNRQRRDDPTSFHFHGSDGTTFLTWLDSLKNARGDIFITFDWWEQNNSSMIDRSDFDMESVFLTWDNGNRKYDTKIDTIYKCDVQMFASF